MLTLLIIAVIVVAAAGVAGAIALATSSKKEFMAANQVVEGRPSRAPASWAGSHEPAARLHRRLRDSMRALAANESFDHDGSLLDLRVELEQQAVTLDDRLVAVGALPPELQKEALAEATAAVEAVEVTVARLASAGLHEAQPMLERALHRVRERSDLIEQVRAELDQLDAEAQTDPTTAEPKSAEPNTVDPTAVATTEGQTDLPTQQPGRGANS